MRSRTRSPLGIPAMVWRVSVIVRDPDPASSRLTNCRSVAPKAASGMLLTRAQVHCADPSALSGAPAIRTPTAQCLTSV